MESAAIATVIVIVVVVIVFALVTMWKLFVKAGRPGWACLIPYYNVYIMIKIAGKPGYWLALMLIPFVNIVLEIMVLAGIANKFGKGGGFAVGLIFLPFIFFPILAFGSATYHEDIEEEKRRQLATLDRADRAQRTCPGCGQTLTVTSEECPWCGARLAAGH